MADYQEVGDVATPVAVSSIKAAAEEKMATLAGASPSLTPEIELSDKTVTVNADGKNTQAVQAEVKVPKLKAGEMLEADMKPTVTSKVNNDKLGGALRASGHADVAEDLRTLNQAMKLDNAGGAVGPKGTMEKDPRLTQRMNMTHRKASTILGFDQQPQPGAKPQKLEDINQMKPEELAARVKQAQANNPGLAGKEPTPQAIKDLNEQKLADRANAMKNPANVEKITIGMTGLNFKQDRKNTIEKGSDYSVAPQQTTQKPDEAAPKVGNGRRGFPHELHATPVPGAVGTTNAARAQLEKSFDAQPQPTPAKSGLDVIANTLENAAKPANTVVSKPQQKITPPTAKLALTPSMAPSPYQTS
jgi:hypothetical protein